MKMKLIPLLVLLISLCAFEVFAASGDVWIDPATVTTSSGNVFLVLVAHPSSAVSTALLDLTFDKDKLEVINIEAGSSLTSVGWTIGKKVYDNNLGTINFQAYSFASPLPSKESTIFTISFKVKATTSGSAQINIVKAEMKSGTTNYITGTKTGATITYSAPVACTANDWTVSWGACSSECGGTQTSTVTKKAASASCTGETGKPAASQSCGTCPSGKTCSNGACVAGCVNECSVLDVQECTVAANSQPGYHKCIKVGDCLKWDSPISCTVGNVCSEGKCCTPACSGKQCGSNGCGGSCGSCAAGSVCQADGTCSGQQVNYQIDAGNEKDKTLLQTILSALKDGNKSDLQKISAIASALSTYFG